MGFGFISKGIGAIGSAIGDAVGGTISGMERGKEFKDVDPNGLLTGASGQAGAFANQAQGGYGAAGERALQTEDMLRRRAMGEDSLSAEQLRQGLQQNLAAQQSMAAGARPGGGAMAARQASMNAANLGAGLSGQQAMAGIQERQQAANALSQHQLQGRGQDLQAVLGSRGQQIGGYGALEQARTGRYGSSMQQPTGTERVLGGIMGLGSLLSDERSKQAVADATEDVEEFMAALKPRSYEYKGGLGQTDGRRLGVMAQDVERSKLGKLAVSTVADGPAKGYKALDAHKMQSALLASAANLNDRLQRLEGKKRG